jgi:FAD/FMN-containing dehydrogenase
MPFDELEASVTGEVLAPADVGFDDARSVWNARFARMPEVIVRCRNTADVRAAVRFAGARGLRISVKGGGHSYGGRTVADGGLLIDLSAMKDIDVDPSGAIVRVQPGVLTAEMDAATQVYAMATPSVTVSTVGVAGSSLGGGSGNLTRKHGLMVDNLLSAEVVTADGAVVRATEDENPDLLWGLRGAGANLGIVTSFDFRLYPVGPQVLAGQIIYPFDDGARLLRVFRDFIADAADDLQVFPFMFRVPPIDDFPERYHSQVVVDFVSFHTDPAAEPALGPLRGLGEPVLEIVGPTDFTVAQQAFDANLPSGQRYYSKAHYLDALTDEVIDTLLEHVPKMEGPLTAAYFEPLGGAAGRVDPASTAFGHRSAAYSFHILAGWMDEAEDGAVMSWARGLHDDMAAHATGGVYVNLLGEEEAARVPAAYGANYRRLVDLKSKWDPENVFSMNYNVAPGPAPA